MQLEYSWNVSTTMQDCISIAAGINSDISVLKEPNKNALRMLSKSLDCRSNAARIQLERPD